jgi:hypothetical protein
VRIRGTLLMLYNFWLVTRALLAGAARVIV